MTRLVLHSPDMEAPRRGKTKGPVRLCIKNDCSHSVCFVSNWPVKRSTVKPYFKPFFGGVSPPTINVDLQPIGE